MQKRTTKKYASMPPSVVARELRALSQLFEISRPGDFTGELFDAAKAKLFRCLAAWGKK